MPLNYHVCPPVSSKKIWDMLSLEKGGEGGISGTSRLQKSTLFDGVLLSYVAIFALLIFFLWKLSVLIRVPLKIFAALPR